MGDNIVRAREPRRKILIKARMRHGCSWGDVYLLNISSRGLLIQATETLERGTYIEVRRGRHAITARVAWSDDQRFGVQTREKLPIDEIIAEPDLSGTWVKPDLAARPGFDRRSPSRKPDTAELGRRGERNRWAARAGQFVCVAAFGASAAFFVVSSAFEILSRPLAQVSRTLGAADAGGTIQSAQ